jgi:hypothetical protein
MNIAARDRSVSSLLAAAATSSGMGVLESNMFAALGTTALVLGRCRGWRRIRTLTVPPREEIRRPG